ncbi:MAG: aldehyde:ferredoxin oxidoreductase, partial [Firmicutes bacterium]|nr:aldehyde:ferredoxin oxidoreductase [Bacillota bacterium]
LELCQFCFGPGLLYGVSDMVELLNAATGWSTTLWEIMQVGERRINLMRMFNIREGFTSEDDDLPARIFEPLQGGLTEGNRIERREFEKAKKEYYEMMGWCPCTGIPTELKLKELALEWILEAKEDEK